MDGPSAELVCSIIILIVFFYCVSRRHLLLGQVYQLGRNWQFPLVQGIPEVSWFCHYMREWKDFPVLFED